MACGPKFTLQFTFSLQLSKMNYKIVCKSSTIDFQSQFTCTHDPALCLPQRLKINVFDFLFFLHYGATFWPPCSKKILKIFFTLVLDLRHTFLLHYFTIFSPLWAGLMSCSSKNSCKWFQGPGKKIRNFLSCRNFEVVLGSV